MNRTLPFDDYGQSVKENTITSFNLAAKSGADFVEFDVQVTQDGHPVIFHDDLIMVKEQASKRIRKGLQNRWFGKHPTDRFAIGQFLWMIPCAR